MIGLTGEVVQILNPLGVVKVRDEYWQAKSVGGDVGVGREVEIVNISGLRVEVKPKEQ